MELDLLLKVEYEPPPTNVILFIFTELHSADEIAYLVLGAEHIVRTPRVWSSKSYRGGGGWSKI